MTRSLLLLRRCLPVLAIASTIAATAAPASAAPSSLLCAAPARAQAKKLLAFHFGDDSEQLHVDDAVAALPSIANPADKRQRYDVLEVWGYVYKGRYRMRLEYFRPTPRAEDCVLMGQEILEFAKP